MRVFAPSLGSCSGSEVAMRVWIYNSMQKGGDVRYVGVCWLTKCRGAATLFVIPPCQLCLGGGWGLAGRGGAGRGSGTG